jgi:hypothetical protein
MFSSISIPDIAGLADFKPVMQYSRSYFSSTGWQEIDLGAVPSGKIWVLEHISVAHDVGSVDEVEVLVKDSGGTTILSPFLIDDISQDCTENVIGALYLSAGEYLKIRYNVAFAPAYGIVSVSGYEVSYGGV